MGLGSWVTGAVLAGLSVSLDRLQAPVAVSYFDQPSPGWGFSTSTTTEAEHFEHEEEEEEAEDAPSFFSRRRGMPAVSKWAKLYVTSGRGQGRVVLAIARLHPRKRNDATWTVVDSSRRVSTLNLNDRRRVSARRTTGVQWEEFPPLSRDEKREAEEASRDLVLRASRPPPSAWLRKLSWVATPVTMAWTWSTFGAAGLGAVLLWRVARYLQVFSVLASMYDAAAELAEVVHETTDVLERLEEAWLRGELELPLLSLGFVALVGWLLWTCWRGPTSSRRFRPTPPASESGSEAGHSLPPSDDEMASTTEDLKSLIATLHSEIKTLRKERDVTTQRKNRPSPRANESPPPPTKARRNNEHFNSESDSGGSSVSGGGPPGAEAMMPAVDKLLARLREHEAAVMMDRAAGPSTRTTAQAAPASSSPPPPASSTGATSGSEIAVGALRDALRDPREKVLEQLEGIKSKVEWSLPANVSERVAPPLLVQVFSQHPSCSAMASRWIQEKQLERNHVAHEMVLVCMVMDKSLLSNQDFVNTEGCEILARRIYALKKAFENVKNANDWRQPKGAGAAKWKSKVRWDLANEIDLRALTGDMESIPSVDKELQARMKERALLHKYVDQAATAGASVEDN